MTTKHSVDKQAAPLMNRRRVWQGVWLFAPGALAVLFPGSIGSALNLERWIVAVIGLLALLHGIYWSASGAKCSGCKLNLLWYGMTRAKNADWLTWVMNARSCPQCGYPESDRLKDQAGRRVG